VQVKRKITMDAFSEEQKKTWNSNQRSGTKNMWKTVRARVAKLQEELKSVRALAATLSPPTIRTLTSHVNTQEGLSPERLKEIKAEVEKVRPKIHKPISESDKKNMRKPKRYDHITLTLLGSSSIKAQIQSR
jgi:hypothetical protein